jgi:hypothetical protein
MLREDLLFVEQICEGEKVHLMASDMEADIVVTGFSVMVIRGDLSQALAIAEEEFERENG